MDFSSHLVTNIPQASTVSPAHFCSTPEVMTSSNSKLGAILAKVDLKHDPIIIHHGSVKHHCTIGTELQQHSSSTPADHHLPVIVYK